MGVTYTLSVTLDLSSDFIQNNGDIAETEPSVYPPRVCYSFTYCTEWKYLFPSMRVIKSQKWPPDNIFLGLNKFPKIPHKPCKQVEMMVSKVNDWVAGKHPPRPAISGLHVKLMPGWELRQCGLDITNIWGFNLIYMHDLTWRLIEEPVLEIFTGVFIQKPKPAGPRSDYKTFCLLTFPRTENRIY